MRGEDIEAMQEILQDTGISCSVDVAKVIAEAFSDHLSMSNDTHEVGLFESKCEKCIEKDEEIKRLNREIGVYKESVKKRRGASHVYIENGSVKYDLD